MSTTPGRSRSGPAPIRRRGADDPDKPDKPDEPSHPDQAVRRALRGLALLAGFPVAGTLLLLALLAADYLVLHDAVAMLGRKPGTHLSGPVDTALLKVLVPATLLATAAFGWGLFRALRPRRATPAGVPVAPAAQPELWDRVRRLAEAVGTRCPTEVRIGAEPVAEVSERSLVFGLVPGRRSLLVGAPLLVALSERQLDAVLAHELAHFAHLDTRWGPVVARGRSAVLSSFSLARAHQRDVEPTGWDAAIVAGKGDGERMAMVAVRSYARLFLTLTEAVSRRQEYAADLVSARIAGRRNAINALSLLPVVEVCHEVYRERFVRGGLEVGLVPTPADSVAGFGAMMGEPEYSALMERARRTLPERERTGAFDSHPPMYDRVAVLRALPDDGRPEDDWSAARAVTLLRDPAGVMTAAASAADTGRHGHAITGGRAVDWDTLVDAVARRRAAVTAEPLARAVASMRGTPQAVPADLVDLVGRGRLGEVLAWVDPGAVLSGATAADRGLDPVRAMLRAWVLATLADRGTVRWRHSWSGFAALDAPPGTTRRIARACAALLSENPDTAPLRAVLDAGRAS